MKNKFVTLLAVFFKVPLLLKVIKLAKFAKPMVTMVSILISLCAYSIAYNPLIAVGLVGLMFFHEMGHVIAMNKEGFKTSGPVFIPFLGAALFAPKDMDRRQEAVIAIGGPFLGSLCAYIILAIYFVTGAPWALMMGYLGITLNLFNLVPISPLDGGRITQAVGKYFKIIGILVLIATTLLLKNPGLFLIWILVVSDFKFLSQRGRFSLYILFEVLIVWSLITGWGMEEQASMMSTVILDGILGAVAILFTGYQMYRDPEESREVTDTDSDRPAMATRDKILWFLVWFITTGILGATLFLLQPSIVLLIPS